MLSGRAKTLNFGIKKITNMKEPQKNIAKATYSGIEFTFSSGVFSIHGTEFSTTNYQELEEFIDEQLTISLEVLNLNSFRIEIISPLKKTSRHLVVTERNRATVVQRAEISKSIEEFSNKGFRDIYELLETISNV